MLTIRKQTCTGCHFFVRNYHQRDGKVFTLEVSTEQRVAAKAGDTSCQREGESLSCHKGIWDEGLGFPGTSKPIQIAQTRRNRQCHFFQYRPGMLLPAAEKLLETALATKLETQKYRLAIYGLLLLALGLLVKLLLGI